MSDWTSVLVALTVPAEWTELEVDEIVWKLRQNEPAMSRYIAGEIKRWGGSDAVDVEALQRVLESLADHDPQEEADDGEG